MDIRRDIIKPIATDVLGAKDKRLMYEIEKVLPRWTIDDMNEAITTGDKPKADQILGIWDYLVDSYADYQDKELASNLGNDFHRYAEDIINIIKVIRECMKQIHDYLDSNSLHAEVVSHGIFERLGSYDPANAPYAPRVVSSLDDIVCPGQRILVGDVDPELLTGGVTADVVFYFYNEDSTWRHDWQNPSGYRPAPSPLRPGNRVCEYESYGYFYEQHQTRNHETRMRHEEYLDAGFGRGGRKRVIFVQDGKYFLCLGLCTLEARRYGHIIFNERPCCFWLYPAF